MSRHPGDRTRRGLAKPFSHTRADGPAVRRIILFLRLHVAFDLGVLVEAAIGLVAVRGLGGGDGELRALGLYPTLEERPVGDQPALLNPLLLESAPPGFGRILGGIRSSIRAMEVPAPLKKSSLCAMAENMTSSFRYKNCSDKPFDPVKEGLDRMRIERGEHPRDDLWDDFDLQATRAVSSSQSGARAVADDIYPADPWREERQRTHGIAQFVGLAKSVPIQRGQLPEWRQKRSPARILAVDPCVDRIDGKPHGGVDLPDVPVQRRGLFGKQRDREPVGRAKPELSPILPDNKRPVLPNMFVGAADQTEKTRLSRGPCDMRVRCWQDALPDEQSERLSPASQALRKAERTGRTDEESKST